MSKKNKKDCKNCVYDNKGTMGGACMHCTDMELFLDKNSKEGKETLKNSLKLKKALKKVDKQVEKDLSIFGPRMITDDNGKYQLVEDAEELLEKLQKSIKLLKNDIKEYQKEINDLSEETHKDKVITELRNDIEWTSEHSLIILTDKELKAEKAFRDKHYKKCAKPIVDKLRKEGHSPACGFSQGSTYIYTIEGTSLGVCIKIKCPICGEELDITDTDKF